jgi:hypothetical protein
MTTPYDQAKVRRTDKTWKRLGAANLCEVCGSNEECTLRTALVNLASHRRARITIGECGIYKPTISFQDLTGVEGSFNTFRRGQGWFNRLIVGQAVGLLDSSKLRLFADATVESIECGPLSDMLEAHAAMNHLMKSQPEHRAIQKLHKVLQTIYGKNYAGLHTRFTVVGLRMEGK